MKEMKISKRIDKIEKWLMSKEWETQPRKKVDNIHVLGSPKLKEFEGTKFKRFAIIIPDSSEFEIFKEFSLSKVNKAISFLKWKRNKYRPNKVEFDYEEAATVLKIWTNSFGVQKGIDRFIIWKFSVK
jgi:hypothetical protein